MFSVFKSISVSDGYDIVEPPAGIIPEVNKRLNIYKDDGGMLSLNVWAAVFILACLHKNGKSVAVQIAETIPECQITSESDGTTTTVFNRTASTLRGVYCQLSDIEFKAIINEFLFNINRDTLEEWFEVVDKSCYITKKATTEVKND